MFLSELKHCLGCMRFMLIVLFVLFVLFVRVKAFGKENKKV